MPKCSTGSCAEDDVAVPRSVLNHVDVWCACVFDCPNPMISGTGEPLPQLDLHFFWWCCWLHKQTAPKQMHKSNKQLVHALHSSRPGSDVSKINSTLDKSDSKSTSSLLKSRNFRYRGNKGLSDTNFNDFVKLLDHPQDGGSVQISCVYL